MADAITAAFSEADIENIINLDDDALASLLVTAGAGTEYDVPGPDNAALMIAKNLKSTSAINANWIWDRAQRMFERAWPAVKGLICRAYKDRADLVVGSKDWLTYIVGVIVPALGISAAFVGVLALWAARQGLDLLCGGDAEGAAA